MKLLVIGAFVAGSMVTAAQAEPNMTGEIAYPKESIGYEALMQGDNARAVSQIMSSEGVSRNDPARLLNLGRAYARMGRTEDAARVFQTALQSDSVDLVLADGRVLNSKVAARQAVANLQTRLATR